MANEQRGPSQESTPPPTARVGGRCHWCGYALHGLSLQGTCPECGTVYNDRSARLLQPPPSAFRICLRVGWPVVGLALVVGLSTITMPRDAIAFVLLIIGYGFLVAIPFNSYFQVRSMLRKHMPEGRRTQGTVAVLRAMGTGVCILAAIVFLAPAVLLGACLIMMSGSEF